MLAEDLCSIAATNEPDRRPKRPGQKFAGFVKRGEKRLNIRGAGRHAFDEITDGAFHRVSDPPRLSHHGLAGHHDLSHHLVARADQCSTDLRGGGHLWKSTTGTHSHAIIDDVVATGPDDPAQNLRTRRGGEQPDHAGQIRGVLGAKGLDPVDHESTGLANTAAIGQSSCFDHKRSVCIDGENGSDVGKTEAEVPFAARQVDDVDGSGFD